MGHKKTEHVVGRLDDQGWKAWMCVYEKR